MKLSLCVALVHNRNQARNSYIRSYLDRLCNEIEHVCHVEKIEVSFQGAVEPHGSLMAFFRDLMYFRLGCKWNRYRLLSYVSTLYNLLGFLKRSLVKYIFARQTIGNHWKKNSAIEVAVTDKHIRVWSRFLDTNADWLLCFEDDAIFKNDSINNLEKLFGQLVDVNSYNSIYIDLAGGCDLNDMQIERLLEKQDEYFRYYKKPVTNTTCVYMMNRSLVSEFHRVLTRKPLIRLVGIDWMINNLFIHLNNTGLNGRESICMHAAPTFFKHGTKTGDYVSWQEDSLKPEMRKL